MKKLYPFSFFPYAISKTRIFISAVALFFCCIQNSLSQPGWIQQSSPISIDLVSVSFVNEFTGYACGGTKMIKTTNGGTSWFVFDSTSAFDSYSKIQFINQNTGFIGIGNYTYKTTNAGTNWVSTGIASPTFGMVDSSFGWINEETHMNLTGNGGNSWYPVGYYPITHTGAIDGSFGSTRNFGIAVGHFSDPFRITEFMYVWKTLNGGSSWTCISGYYSNDPCAFSTAPMFSPTFTKTFVVDDFTAFLYGGGQDLKTFNSGANWSYLNLGSSIAGFKFVNNSTGYAVGGNGLIQYTTTGGNTWNLQTTPVTIKLNSLDMVNSATGWAVGSSGVILKTTTGGLILPLAPSLVSPANNSTGVQITPLLDWYDNLQSVNYRVQISTDTNFSSILVDNNSIVASQFNVPPGILTYYTNYYWRVSAKNNQGWGPFSGTWNFRTFYLPGQAILSSPVNNSIEQPTNLTFRWFRTIETLSQPGTKSILTDNVQSQSDIFYNTSETDAINKYWFELTSDTVTLAGLLRDTTLGDTSKFVGGLSLTTSYYWRVKANNVLGWGPFSSWWKFTTIVGPPQAPVLNNPANQSIQQHLGIPFNWYRSVELTSKPKNGKDLKIQNLESVPGSEDAISKYWFEITSDTVTYSGIIKDTTLTDTTKLLSLSGSSVKYFWRVKAKNQSGWGVFSNWWEFMTIPAQMGWYDVSGAFWVGLSTMTFFDTQTGWATGGSGYVFKSTDGGSNWSYSSAMGMGSPNAIIFSNPNTGNIATGPWSGFGAMPIWYSTNGGTNWQGVAFTDIYGCDLRSVTYIGGKFWFCGSMNTTPPRTPYSTIFYTYSAPSLGHSIPLNRIRAGLTEPWTVGNNGLVYHTTTPCGVGNSSVNLSGVSFRDANTGYVVGGAYMYKSTNYGGSWTRIYPLYPSATYNDVYFANKDTGWVACSLPGQGAVIGTTNGGTNWSIQYIGPYAGSEFTFANNSTGWLLCGNRILKTGTGGLPSQLETPVLLTPASGSTGLTLTPTLDWYDATGATKYKIQVSEQSNFSSNIIDDSTITLSQYVIPAGRLNIGTVYYWRAAAGNDTVWSQFSGVWSFTTRGLPLQVVLSSPQNNSTSQPTDITFSWQGTIETLKKMSPEIRSEKFTNRVNDYLSEFDAIGNYWFELTTDTVTLAGLVRDTVLTDTTKSLSGLNYLVKYYWRVKAKGDLGWGQFSSWWNFTTSSGLPMQVYLNSPFDNSINQPVDLNFNWYKAGEPILSRNQKNVKNENTEKILNNNLRGDIDAVTSYWFELTSDTATFAGIVRDTVLTDTTKTVSGLSNSTVYYWRVKAKNDAGWGAFSNWWKFTTIIAAPSAPVLVSPADGSTGQNVSLSLAWNKLPSAVTYRLQVSSDSLFTGLVVNDSALTDSTSVISGLNPLTFYWWRVNAKNIGGTSGYSAAWKFKTIGYPAIVTLINPPNNAVSQPINVDFRWSRAFEQMSPLIKTDKQFRIDGGIDAISLYCFDMVTDTVSMANLLRDTTLSDTTKTVGGLGYLTNYYWRVKAKGQLGWGNYSVWFKFTTIISAPLAPMLVSPPDNAIGQDISLMLVWNKVSTAVNYRVQAATDSLFAILIVNDSTLTDSVRNISGLSPLTYYWWRVSAKNSGGTSVYSAVFKFKTMGAPTQVLLVAPPDNAINQAVNPTCVWRKSTDLLAPWVKNTGLTADENESIINYWFDMVTDTATMANLLRDTTLTDSSKAVSGLSYLTSYFWRVRAKNQIGWGSYSVWFKFTTIPLPPALMNLTVIPGGFYNTSTNQLNMKDTINVYLVDSVTCMKVDSSKGVLDSVNFTMPLSFGNAVTGSYYMIVYHRNHLGIAAMFTQNIVRGSTVSYDFTTDSAKAFGFNMVKVSNSPVKWGMIPGDANRDGFIDAIDQFMWEAQNGLDGYLSADFNGDGFVDAIDQTAFWVVNNGLSSFLPCGFTLEQGTQKLIQNSPNYDAKKGRK